MNNFSILLIFIGSLSLSLTYILTTFSFIIRIVGALNNINAKSWNLASAITLLNSFFIALALSSIAFFIDSRPSLHLLNYIFLISSLLVCFGHIYMIFKIEKTVNFIVFITNIYFSKGLIQNNKKYKFESFKFDFFSYVAWIFFMIGFIFPSFLAVIFNEYRTTLFQLSFIFNSLGTFITIIITDRKASLLSDKSNLTSDESLEIINYLSKVIANRLYASLLILLLLIIMFFIL
tara:strand:+ start:255 stop:956 length:702 start_codon:yes stop_codon:yes gene_type:complete